MAHPLITEDMVERAAREYERMLGGHSAWGPAMYAALNAVSDEIVEWCLTEVEQEMDAGAGEVWVTRRIYDRIAALKRSPEAT